MAKHRKPRRTDDRHIAGVERIDASPEDIARAMFRTPSQAKGPRKPSNPRKDDTKPQKG